MKVINRLTHEHIESSFDIHADRDLYKLIVEDMLNNAGNFAPRSVWQKLYDASDVSTYKPESLKFVEEILTDQEMRLYAEEAINRYPTLSSMLDAWIGPRGKKNELSDEMVKEYTNYMSAFDENGFLRNFLESNSYKLLTDITTTEEISILNAYITNKEFLNVLEVGGGYGRLCEGIINVFDDQVKYVMADSVPISLMYSYLFLKLNLPNKKIGIYHIDKDLDLEAFDCLIIPTWRLEEFCVERNRKFDLAINIQSMQEMSQWHVDYYLNFFENNTTEEAIIYLNNNKKYIFKGNWNYPSNWQLLTRNNTPWSWSDDCPTEVFRKQKRDYAKENFIVDASYKRSIESKLKNIGLASEISDLNKRIIDSQTQLKSLENDKNSLGNRNNELSDELVLLSNNNEKYKQEIKKYELQIEKYDQETKKYEHQIEKYEQEVMNYIKEIEEHKQNICQLRNKNNTLIEEINGIYSSKSWKITKPLRIIKKTILKNWF